MKIAYKIVAAILALLVIPIAVFGPILYYNVQSTAMQLLFVLGEKTGNETITEYMKDRDQIPNSIADSISIVKTYSLVNDVKNIAKISDALSEDSNADSDAALQKLEIPVISTVIIFISIVACAFIAAFFAIFSKNNRKVIYTALSGIGLSIVLTFSFESVAAPFIDGTISLSSVTNSIWASLIATVNELTLSSTYWLIPVCFGAVIIWTFFYNITLPESEKINRKIMLGENEESK